MVIPDAVFGGAGAALSADTGGGAVISSGVRFLLWMWDMTSFLVSPLGPDASTSLGSMPYCERRRLVAGPTPGTCTCGCVCAAGHF